MREMIDNERKVVVREKNRRDTRQMAAIGESRPFFRGMRVKKGHKILKSYIPPITDNSSSHLQLGKHKMDIL